MQRPGSRPQVAICAARVLQPYEIGVLVESSEGPLLVYAMEVEDVERSREAADRSQHAVDAEHRRAMGAALADEPPFAVLLNLRTE